MKELSNFPVQLNIPVRWADMDAFKHVNNVVYLQWAEMARIQYLTSHITGDLNNIRLGPILSRQDCRYIFPITFPDTVTLGCRVSKIQEDRFTFEIKIFSQKYEKLCAIIYNTVMAYDFVNLRKSDIPVDWVMKIQDIEE
jgi:acyl-CoA thioester hydrolase